MFIKIPKILFYIVLFLAMLFLTLFLCDKSLKHKKNLTETNIAGASITICYKI